jgi:predicted DNA-binding protein
MRKIRTSATKKGDMIETGSPLVTIQLRLPRETIERIDGYRHNMATQPSRARTVRWMVESRLNQLEEQEDA